MSLDTTSLPSELLTAPQPLIGICGLDIGRNTVHKNVWDAFSNNRKSDRPAAAYKLLPANYEFPVAKPKRNSYEWYHPKGILKRNWMLKHLHVLPSVVVVFQELEWNDPQWTEISLYCASTIQALKNALQERNTRICLVLLQKSAPLPPGEDLLATERATSLTVTCGLNTKMLFILPHNEHIMGYVLRLESAFLDLAQTYYALMSKRIRTHRDQLTTAHTTLKLRHQFKLGFVAEIRQDFNTALKHYTQAYSNLDEIRITDVNCLEIKTIAGFLNYKICRLMFKLKVPRDAINNFISHIEKYKNRSGFKEIIFEHYAWLSTQHSVFAELFCEAVKNGLPALQTQHPGMYYYKAAEYIVKRRESFQQSNALMLSPIETSAPTTLQANSSMGLFTEYFGIRAVKAGEPLSEQQVNMFVCEQEKNFNHSSAIITLLGQAMAQFKIYKGLRFRKKLAIDMAEEYFKSGDHAKALTLYSLMLPDYREDKWSVIFSDVLFKTLRCALLSASVGDYISCSIEALSLKNRSERKERIVVLENLWKVFACVPPVPHGQIAPELRDLWQNAWSSAKTPVPIDLDKVAEVLDLSASFEKVELQNDEMINVLLLVKVLTDVPLKMQRFSLIISDGTRSFKLMPSKYAYCSTLSELRDPAFIASMEYQAIETDLVLEPHYYYQLLFATEAKQFFENTQLYVTRIEALMGSDKLAALLFKNAALKRKQFREHSRIKHLDDTMPINSMCYIVPTFHLSAQTQLAHPRMLVNEYFPVTTLISNPHDVFLLNVGLSVSVPNELRNKVFLTTDIAAGRQKLHSQLQIDIGEMSMHASNTAVFYVFSLIETSITLQQRLYYNLDIEKPRSLTTTTTTTVATSGTTTAAAGGTTTQATQITENIALSNSTDVSPEHIRAPPPPPLTAAALQNGGGSDTAKASSAYTSPPIQVEFLDETTLRKTREDVLTLECDLEFKFSGRYYTLNKKPLQRAYRGENFLLRVNMEVMSTHTELDILDTYFICDHNLVQSNYSFKRKKFSHTYRRGDKLEDVVVLRSNATLSDWLTAKEFERSKSDTKTLPQWRLHAAHSKVPNPSQSQQPETDATNSSDLQKSLLGKIANNMTIVNGNTTTPAATAIPPAMSLLFAANQTGTPTMSNSLTSEDGNLEVAAKQQPAQQLPLTNSTRCIFNRAMEAIQPTGHHRGFIRGIVTTDKQQAISPGSGQLQQNPPFGIYCIKWRRHGGRDEIESKFLINGLDIAEPLLNVYCSIEERMFVKMPMTFKVTLKNPTSKVLHLIATLSISNIDNFICSGHKQLDVSIFAFGEKELVYNLYPLYVGWQNLPELTLEFNTQVDPSKDDKQNKLLNELVERSMPKKVFVLPPLKQQTK